MTEGLNAVKIFLPTVLAFFIGIGITPILTHYLYKYKAWKKVSVQKTLDGKPATISQRIHKDEIKKTPRMGGIVIWASTLITIVLVWLIYQLIGADISHKLNFLSREQTWLPLFTLVAASLVGLADDLLQVQEKGTYIGGGLSLKVRIGIVLLIGLIGGFWFFLKLQHSDIEVPFYGIVTLGWLIVPLFMLVMLALFSGGVIDGIDGLSGGIMAVIFSAYAIIAYAHNQIDLAAFCATITGATLAFLWFNIPPARFYMTETGILGLTTTLAVVAFLTKAVLVLVIIALPLFAASGSVIIQQLSKKFRGKKVFLVAPIHHHFEALGWPAYKVTMRFWIISVVCAIIGVVITLIG